jgi:Uma2 family endonuclease
MVTTAHDIIQKHRLTVDEYHRMGEAGILRQVDRVELIEGEIIDISPIGSDHAGTVNYLNQVLFAALQEKAIISTQNPIILNNRNEPEPDIVLLKPRDDFYRQSHPTPTDVLLIIEVADTSLRYDREIKIPLYARHNIPEVWLIDLENNQLTKFFSPNNSQYETSNIVTDHSQVSIQELPDLKINLTKLFEK